MRIRIILMILKAMSRVYRLVLSPTAEGLFGDYTAICLPVAYAGTAREGRIRSDAFSNPPAAAAAVE
jgi:hypothetical protein